MKKSILAILCSLLSIGCDTTSKNIKSINKEEAKIIIKKNKNLQIIDVRTPQETQSGMIKGAVNIDLFSPDFITKINKIQKNVPVLIYCRSGKRSLKAAKEFDKLDFKNIYNLKGGYLNWK